MVSTQTAPISFTDAAAQRAAARRLHGRLEAVHTLVYFASQVHEAHRGAGLKGRMMGYTAGRIAPMGAVGPEVATAVFYGFSPQLLARALPDAWSFASPGTVLDVTQTAVAGALTELWEGLESEVARAAELAREVALLHPILGRPLAAAWSSVPWGDDPALVLWQAASRMRESRGDGHVACLVEAGLDGVECHLSLRGDSDRLREVLGPLRGYDDAVFDAAVERLRDRGLLDADGALTDAGRSLRERVETRTDELASAPWVAFGEERAEQLRLALEPLVEPVVSSGVLPGVIVRAVQD